MPTLTKGGMSDQQRRRKFMFGGMVAAISALFGRRAAAEVTASPDVVTRHMRQGDVPSQPLDSMLLFERGDDSNGRAITHEVLSLIHQERGKNSYPWTLYASLETHHEVGDACVVCSRLHKHGPGWSSGLHSEVFNHARAVALGVNVEMSSDFKGAEETHVIGLNIQAVGGERLMQYGIQIHDRDNHFQTGIGLNGSGATGIDLGGKFGVGIHARKNSIRVSEGTCIELDDAGKVKIRYQGGRIEFLNGDKCVGHLDMNGEDHAI
jgi:hypothetical protein